MATGITRGQLRTQALNLADANGSTRWDAAPGGEVDQLLSVAYDMEWSRCLDAQPQLRVARANVAATNGLLTIPPGSIPRLYRVLKLLVDHIAYRSVRWEEFADAQHYNAQARVWFREGDTIQLLPATDATVEIVASSLPPSITSLADDTTAITVPTDATKTTFELIVAMETAGLLLNKGAAETPATVALQQQAEMARQLMLQQLARLAAKPFEFGYSDLPSEWGG